MEQVVKLKIIIIIIIENKLLNFTKFSLSSWRSRRVFSKAAFLTPIYSFLMSMICMHVNDSHTDVSIGHN